jgi:hypothetical protein
MGQISTNNIGFFIAIGIGIIVALIIFLDMMTSIMPKPLSKDFDYRRCPSGKRSF